MTESQWATSSDPAAMWAVVEATATERQCGHMLSAMYALAYWSSGDNRESWRSWPKSVIIVTCGNWMTGDGYADEVPLAYRADLLREIFGSPWRPYWNADESIATGHFERIGEQGTCYSVLDKWQTWHDGAIPRMAQAIYGDTTPSEPRQAHSTPPPCHC